MLVCSNPVPAPTGCGTAEPIAPVEVNECGEALPSPRIQASTLQVSHLTCCKATPDWHFYYLRAR
jgi:hypothetical protein